MIETFFNKTW